jgi:YHS domain-containing protein
MMKPKPLMAAALAITFATAPLLGLAADQAKPKPYTLKTCPVSGEKLGEMGKPYVFTHEGREIKLCCKDCSKEFKKDPAKYVKKIEEAEAKAKAKKS